MKLLCKYLLSCNPESRRFLLGRFLCRRSGPTIGMSSVQELRAALAKGLDPETLERIDRIAEGE